MGSWQSINGAWPGGFYTIRHISTFSECGPGASGARATNGPGASGARATSGPGASGARAAPGPSGSAVCGNLETISVTREHTAPSSFLGWRRSGSAVSRVSSSGERQ